MIKCMMTERTIFNHLGPPDGRQFGTVEGKMHEILPTRGAIYQPTCMANQNANVPIKLKNKTHTALY